VSDANSIIGLSGEIIDVAAGNNFTVVCTGDGVYTFGDDCNEGCLGRGPVSKPDPIPRLIPELSGDVRISRVECGANHAVSFYSSHLDSCCLRFE